MTYKKLLEAGRAMDEKQIEDSLKGLVNDPRFAAVVAAIDVIKEQTANASCQDRYAGEHGTLEHAAGVRFGLIVLESRIKQITDPPKRRGERKPQEGEE